MQPSDLFDARNILLQQRGKGVRVVLVALTGELHPGKLALIEQARSYGDFFAVGLAEADAVSPAQLSRLAANLVFSFQLPSDSEARIDEIVAELPIDAILVGEKDFPRLLRFEALVAEQSKTFRAKTFRAKTFGAKTLGTNLPGADTPKVIRFPVVRDVDDLPWCRFSEKLSAEERYQARYIPQSLQKAKQITDKHGLQIPILLEQTLENLEKSQGLTDTLCTVVADGDVVRLCVSASVGRYRIHDNTRLAD